MTMTAAVRRASAATWHRLTSAVPLVLLMIGAAVIVAGISMWTVPGATVLAGLFVIAGGVLLLDLDVLAGRRDRTGRR